MSISFLALVAIVGGTVYPVSGPPVEGATVLIEDGRITAVGTNLQVPEGALRVEASGGIVTPGLFDSWTQLGLVEIWAVDQSNDGDDGRSDAIRASHRIVDSYNPASTVIPIQRAHGVTTTMVVPRGGIISGQAAVYDLGATRPVKAPVGLVARFGGRGGGSRSATLARLREVIFDARVYGKNRRRFEENRSRRLATSRLDLEALQPLVKGEVPLLLQVDRQSDIVRALEFAEEMDIKLVLIGAREAWREAERIAAAGVGVVLDPSANSPSSFDTIHSRADAAALLAKAGVRVAISTFSTHNVRKLRQWAGNAVREGMSKADALRAVTRTPAELMGLSDRGLIAPGMVANVVVWSGDPFEFSSEVKHVLIGGRLVDLDHRQRALLRRYRSQGSPRQ